MAFKLPTLSDVQCALPPCDLQSFDYSKIDNQKLIGHGGFGIVYKATHEGRIVVVKKVASESLRDEKLFLKEAKLISSLNHGNVVGFLGFCRLPCAIMLEYAAFDFEPFGHSKIITNLGDFLNYIDRIDGFKNFDDKLHSKIFSDIAHGLAYLHSKDTAHRDLKSRNVLVSNLHYSDIKDTEKRLSIFEKEPICCKLADFGESKSRQIQTAIINTNTRQVNR